MGLHWNFQEGVLTVNLNWCGSLVVGTVTKIFVYSMAQRVFVNVVFSCPMMLYAK
jgi:hypothetical protein